MERILAEIVAIGEGRQAQGSLTEARRGRGALALGRGALRERHRSCPAARHVGAAYPRALPSAPAGEHEQVVGEDGLPDRRDEVFPALVEATGQAQHSLEKRDASFHAPGIETSFRC